MPTDLATKNFKKKSQSKLIPNTTGELDKVVEFVHVFPEAQLRIETHTDRQGSSSQF